jgi:hypothetical protein
MKRFIFSLFAAVVLLFPSLVLAQEVNSSDKIVDTKFVVVASSLVASTIFDVETIFTAINNHGARELNPFMRPFVNAGRPATYAFVAGVNTGIIYASYRMKKSANPDFRKIWWLMPVTVAASHAIAGGFNLRFVF